MTSSPETSTLEHAIRRGIIGGTSGAMAMTIQVCTVRILQIFMKQPKQREYRNLVNSKRVVHSYIFESLWSLNFSLILSLDLLLLDPSEIFPSDIDDIS